MNKQTTKGDTHMKNNKMFSRVSIAFVMLLMLSSLQQMFAAGTAAGTVITTKAYVSFNAGSNARTDSSSAVTLTVGYRVVLNQDVATASSTSLDSTTIYKYFTVTNSGNWGDDFKFSVVTGSGQNWATSIYRDTSISGGSIGSWEATDIAISDGGTYYIGVDTTIHIVLKTTVPGELANGYVDSVRVSVESNGSGPAYVTRVGGVGLVEHKEVVTIAKPVISIVGSQTTTPANAIPGAGYVYTISLQNTGDAAISGTASLTFKLDDDFSYVSSSGGTPSGSIVTWTGIALPANMASPITRTVNVIIENTSNNGTGARVGEAITIMDSLTASGTPTEITYTDGVNSYSNYASALTPFSVVRASGITTELHTYAVAARSGNPGDTVRRVIAIKNMGNGSVGSPNTYSFTRLVTASTQADSFSYTYDTASTVFGTYTNRADTTGATFTFYLAGGDSMYIAVSDSIFDGTADAKSVTNSYTVSRTDGAVVPLVGGSLTVTLTGNSTTVTAADINVSMSSAVLSGSIGYSAGNPAPGDSVEYSITISNVGSGIATNVSISNVIPLNTTFKTNGYDTAKGVMVGSTANTNASDAPTDYASCNGTTVSAGPYSIANGASMVVKYKVVVN